jgi:RNA polymerase sigma-70 factor, ECF subfamily
MDTINAQQLQSNWNGLQQQLKAFVFKKVKDMAATDDIVQDVFLKVHSRLTQLKEAEKLSGWIFQITRNAITDHFRRQSKILNTVDLDWESDGQVLNECVASCLQEMLITLPDKYREALELTEIKNMSQLQLAETLNISYSGAKSRVQRARQILKDRMDELYVIKMDAYGNVIVCENKAPCSCPQKNFDL